MECKCTIKYGDKRSYLAKMHPHLTSSVQNPKVIAVFPESTRPSLLPRSMYSRDLDLCLSVTMSYFGGGGGLIQLRLLKQGVADRRAFVLFCATFPSIWS